MRKLVLVVGAALVFLAGPVLMAQQPSAGPKVVKVEIVPNSVQDVKDPPFTTNGPIIEVAPATGSTKFQLLASRSYRFIVTVDFGQGKLPSCLLVETEFILSGKPVIVLGKTHIAADEHVYACYDVFPSKAGLGDCVIRTSVDAVGNTPLEFNATIAK